jgi:hypothetical protein
MATLKERLQALGIINNNEIETRQTPAPIEERSIKKARVRPSEKTYEFTYDVGGKKYRNPNVGFLIGSPALPTRPDFTPQRLPEIDPTRQTEGMGGSTQEVIPVSPDDAIQTLMARLTNYYKDDTPAMPVRRQDVSLIPQAFTPRPEPMQGPGLMTPQLPQPNVPQVAMQTYAPDMPMSQMFVDEAGNLVDVLGNIIKPEVTQLQDYSDEELDAIIEAERLRTSEFDFLNQEK